MCEEAPPGQGMNETVSPGQMCELNSLPPSAWPPQLNYCPKIRSCGREDTAVVYMLCVCHAERDDLDVCMNHVLAIWTPLQCEASTSAVVYIETSDRTPKFTVLPMK